MITEISRSLLEAEEPLILHGVNCRGVMAAGVALAISTKWPVVKAEYQRKFATDGWRLGDVQFVSVAPNLTIANCATQDQFGRRKGVVYVDYNAVRACLRTVASTAKAKGWSVAMPRIGAELAGGDWSVIRSILEEEANGVTFTVYVV